jgi:hypothetical protein
MRACEQRSALERDPGEGVDEAEVMVMLISSVVAIATAAATRTETFHRLYLRNNPAPGIVRLGVFLSMGWIGFVLWRYADPSVTGIYVVFYLVMGYAVVKLFGQLAATLYGARTRIDVVERRNVPAALVIAAFTLATGLIFGGSLWGEADPVGDGEGGWWIPLSFFLLGWTTLVIAFALFLRRETGGLARLLQRERSLADARAAGSYLLGVGVTLTEAVSGDFWGWWHGLLTFGVLAAMVIAHESFAGLQARGHRRGTAGGTAGATAGATGGATGGDVHGDGDGSGTSTSDARRTVEAVVYLLLGLGAWGLNRLLDLSVGAG